MTIRRGFGNNKGGVGKTSAIKGIATALAMRGRKVLAVDLDPQANLSRRFGYSAQKLADEKLPTISEALKADEVGCAASAIVPCTWDAPYAHNIDLIPSRFDLENRVSEAATVGAVRRLERVMTKVDDGYDYTFFDFQPSLGHLTQLGMVAAKKIVIVTMPEYDAIDGANRVRDFVATYGEDLGTPDLDIEGVIVNCARTGVSVHNFHASGIDDLFPGKVLRPVIPLRSAITDANDDGAPLTAYNTPASRESLTIYSLIADKLESQQ